MYLSFEFSKSCQYNLKIFKCCRQDLEFSKSCRQDLEFSEIFSKSCRQDLENSKTCRQDLELSKSWQQDLDFSKTQFAARSGIWQILQAFFLELPLTVSWSLYMQTDKLHYNSAKTLREICPQKKF